MSDNWKPGDVAMSAYGVVLCCKFPDGHVGWTYDDSSGGRDTPGELRPLLVIDPEDRKEVERLRDLMDEAYCAQSDGALDFPAERTGARGSALQTALRALANPTPEVPDEPTDPAIRVVDAEGWTWARVGRGWSSDKGHAVPDWGYLADNHGPLTIVTPDPPNAADVQADADDDRPLRVGAFVLIAQNAKGVEDYALGKTGVVDRFTHDGDAIVTRIGVRNDVQRIDPADLTRIGSDA